MFWQGLIFFWYDNYGLWPWQAKPRPKTVWNILMILQLCRTGHDNVLRQNESFNSYELSPLDAFYVRSVT